MAKQQHEEEAIRRFASYLQATGGIAYGVTGRDVLVASGQNYDYELTGAVQAKSKAADRRRSSRLCFSGSAFGWGERKRVGSIAPHPCKERKDGPPLVVVVHAKSRAWRRTRGSAVPRTDVLVGGTLPGVGNAGLLSGVSPGLLASLPDLANRRVFRHCVTSVTLTCGCGHCF
jgi:hypothetical protein